MLIYKIIAILIFSGMIVGCEGKDEHKKVEVGIDRERNVTGDEKSRIFDSSAGLIQDLDRGGPFGPKGILVGPLHVEGGENTNVQFQIPPLPNDRPPLILYVQVDDASLGCLKSSDCEVAVSLMNLKKEMIFSNACSLAELRSTTSTYISGNLLWSDLWREQSSNDTTQQPDLLTIEIRNCGACFDNGVDFYLMMGGYN